MGKTCLMVVLAVSSAFARVQADSASTASAEVSPELVCNPNATRWDKQGSRPGYYAREVQDLHVYNGKIYTAGGDWGAFSNQGPVPVFAIDPATGTFTNEYEAGTDIITDFKTFSDGRLWTACVDGRNGHENEGHFFRREQNGTWTNMTTCLRGHSGIEVKYFEHTWDIAEFDGMIFTAGYGICGSSNWGDTQMFDATPDLPSNLRTYANDIWVDGVHYFNVGNARKFSAFLSFADDLFCFSMNMGYKSDVEVFGWEEWRWNASAGKFVSSIVPWSDIAPGLTDDERSISLPETTADSQKIDIMLTTCRSFGTRILYLVGGTERINVATHRQPWAAYSAINQNHHVKATKIDLGGARPFDIHVSDDAAYIVAAKGTEMGAVVTNSVWKTEDGVTFTEIFHFATNRHATALCKYGDDFYVGMGYSTNVCHIWKNLPKNPELSGDIYRINLNGGSQGGDNPQGGDDPQDGEDPHVGPAATNTIRVAGWPMSNNVVMSDPSARSALYSKLAEQGVDFVYICGGKDGDAYESDGYGFVRCQTKLESNSYVAMTLGYDKGRYDLLASTDTTNTGSQAYLYTKAILTQGLYLQDKSTKEKLFFMAYAGAWGKFSDANIRNWFQWVLGDIAANYPCEKVVLIFPISKSQANMESYLTEACSFDELHYDATATDFAVFASHGKFTLSSVRSIVETSVSANAEGLFEILHTPKGASPAGGRQGFKVTLR